MCVEGLVGINPSIDDLMTIVLWDLFYVLAVCSGISLYCSDLLIFFDAERGDI